MWNVSQIEMSNPTCWCYRDELVNYEEAVTWAMAQKFICYFQMKNDQRLEVKLQQGFESGHLSFASVAKVQLAEISRAGQVKHVLLCSAELVGSTW